MRGRSCFLSTFHASYPLAGYLAALLGLSYYARRSFGPRLWRKAHRATVLVYLLGVFHALGAGSDSAGVWLRGWIVLTGIPIALLFLRRVGQARKRGAGRAPHPRAGRRPPVAPRSGSGARPLPATHE